ncbi:MAG: hypothetical protein K8R88_15585 [Armatimonadetes bacterium]|nr:hypothetical protein [Armatimonadota bacterium]
MRRVIDFCVSLLLGGLMVTGGITTTDHHGGQDTTCPVCTQAANGPQSAQPPHSTLERVCAAGTDPPTVEVEQVAVVTTEVKKATTPVCFDAPQASIGLPPVSTEPIWLDCAGQRAPPVFS